MPHSTKLDNELAKSELSLKCAALVETTRASVEEAAQRIAAEYPDCGLTRDEVAARLYESLCQRLEELRRG